MLFDSNHMILERQSYRDRNQNVGFQGLQAEKMDDKGTQGKSADDRNNLYLDCDGGYLTLSLVKTRNCFIKSTNLKRVHSMVHKLHFKKPNFSKTIKITSQNNF